MCKFSESIYIISLSVIVHGGWGQWGAWDSCPVTCGGADQSRTRECNNPKPESRGNDCTVDGSKNKETKKCNENQCAGTSNTNQEYL